MIKISEFDEREYNLSSIGLEGYYFCIEETVKYIYGPNTYIEINDKTFIEKKETTYIIKDEESELSIPEESFEILKDLIFL